MLLKMQLSTGMYDVFQDVFEMEVVEQCCTMAEKDILDCAFA